MPKKMITARRGEMPIPPPINFFALPVKSRVKSKGVAQLKNLFPILLLLFFASGALAFGYTQVKTWFGPPTVKTPSKTKLPFAPAILGSFLNETLPTVEKVNFASPSAQPTPTPKPLGEALAQETEKIVQDVTAKLLQSLLTQTGTVSQPVDRAVYDACVSILKKEMPTLTPTCSP
jgi:hypothetical protein